MIKYGERARTQMIRPGSLSYYPITPLPYYPITLLALNEAVAEYDYAGESALRIGGGSVGRNE
jgi:hypothetical protein